MNANYTLGSIKNHADNPLQLPANSLNPDAEWGRSSQDVRHRVNAMVNYATEKAAVTVPAGYDPQALIAEVEKAGYAAALPEDHEQSAAEPTSDDHELASLPREQVGPFLLLGLDKTADKEQIEANWADMRPKSLVEHTTDH